MFGVPFSPALISWSYQNVNWFMVAIAAATVGFITLMWSLHQLSPQAKKWMTIVCTFIAGLFFSLEYFLPATKTVKGEEQNFLTPWIDPVSNFVLYMMIWTLALGIISLLMVHGKRLAKRQPGWHNSLALFIAMFSIAALGLMTNVGESGSNTAKLIYNSLFYGLLVNLDAAMFSLLAFYIASAAYRAFRVRTLESGLLMGAALIVMLGMVNFGVMMTNWIPTDSWLAFFRVEVLSQWILNWINMPAYRAVLIGVGVGSLAMAIRLWLSLERGTFFSQEK